MKPIPSFMPALLTPFDPDGEIDLPAYRFNLQLLLSRRIGGFVIGGSTGEGPYLEPGERRVLVAAAREEAPDGYLLCGINAETLRGATSQIGEAAESGADAVLVITPTTLVRSKDAEIESFYLDVADSSPLPVFLYTVPRVTGYELPVDAVSRLREHPGIAGMKDSGGDARRISQLAGEAGDPFAMFIGASKAIAAGVAAGALGAITASGNYAWPLVTRLVAAAGSSQPETAGLQASLTELIGPIESFGISGTKAAAGMVGLRAGLPRRPLLPLHPSQYAAIERALDGAGLERA